LPLVVALTFRQSILVAASINISVFEHIRSLSTLQRGLPLPLILVSVLPRVNAMSVNLIVFPFADIAVSMESFPQAVPFFLAMDPFSFKYLSIGPVIRAFSMRMIVLETS